MQAVLLGSTRNFSTTFINGGFVRERSTVAQWLDSSEKVNTIKNYVYQTSIALMQQI